MDAEEGMKAIPHGHCAPKVPPEQTRRLHTKSSEGGGHERSYMHRGFAHILRAANMHEAAMHTR